MATNARKNAPDRDLRADAKRNREKLLTAAEQVCSEQGADVSLDDIAKRAKVGIGTLYRHFPNRDALLAAACDDRLLSLAAESRARVFDSSADAFSWFLEALVRHASIYRGLAASLGVVLQAGSPGCSATTEEGERLLRAAQAAREIRRDVAFDDVVSMAAAISIAASEDPAGLERVARLVGLFVDGLRARPGEKQSRRAR